MAATLLVVFGSGVAQAEDPFYPPEETASEPAVVMSAPSDLEKRIDALEQRLLEMQSELRRQRRAERNREASESNRLEQAEAEARRLIEDAKTTAKALREVPVELEGIPGGSKMIGRSGKTLFYRDPQTRRVHTGERPEDGRFPHVIPAAPAQAEDGEQAEDDAAEGDV